MMAEFQVAYIPVGVPTFHLESAQKEFEQSIELLKGITDQCVYPEEMLLSIDLLQKYLDKINPDCIILQNITFANAAYPSEVLKRFDCPVLLWTLREPVIDGGRLRLNSLTGAYSAGNALMAFRDGNFEYIFGGPGEEEVREKIRAVVQAAKLKKALTELKLTSIGHTPQGFGFGRAMDTDMMKYFGVTLDSIEARELINKAKAYTDEECQEYLEKAKASMKGLDQISENNVKDFARLYKAYSTLCDRESCGRCIFRCWPDFCYGFRNTGMRGAGHAEWTPASWQAASPIRMELCPFIGTYLTGKPVFPSEILFPWMRRKIQLPTGTAEQRPVRWPEIPRGAEVGLHCNRHIGPTMELAANPVKRLLSSVWDAWRTVPSGSSWHPERRWTSRNSSTEPLWWWKPRIRQRMWFTGAYRPDGNPISWLSTGMWPESWRSWAIC